MTQNLKCVIFGDRDVIKNENKYFSDVKKLIDFLAFKNIQPIVLSNDQKSERILLETKFKTECPKLNWYIADRDGTPKKPKPESIQWILKSFNLEPHEAIYIGNSDVDMQTAVNSGLLFLNASWYGKNTNYGFEFKTPYEIARFIDIFCLRDYLWKYSICHQDIEYYALGIFGTIDPEYSIYTQDAKEAAKYGRGHLDFWLKYLVSSIYFSGLHKRISYIAPYPGHKQWSTPTVMEEALVIFAKCFKKTYLKDLIIRHTTAKKSAYARYNKESLDCLNQLNTIMLNEHPLRGDKEQSYKKSPLKPGKTVLVVDDFCTQGYSLEAARAYVEQTGAKAICLSLLKTINKDYEQISKIHKFSPFEPNQFLRPGIVTTEKGSQELGYEKLSKLAEGLKKLVYKAILRKNKVQLYEKQGEKIIKRLFEVYTNFNFNKNLSLLPPELRAIANQSGTNDPTVMGKRVVIDYIAGMMDSFAIKEYQRYFGASSLDIIYDKNR